MQNNKGALTLPLFMLIVATDVLESAAELFFKKGTLATGIQDITFSNMWVFLCRVAAEPNLWIGILLYFVNFLFWILVLSRVDLSVAFPVGSTTYIFVPALSIFFLHEKVMPMRWLGIAFIIAGVLFISKSTRIEKTHEP